LRYGGRAADFTQEQDFHLKVASGSRDAQLIPNADLARGLDGPPIGMNSAQFAGASRQRAGFEESRRPQPFVHSYARHKAILLQGKDFDTFSTSSFMLAAAKVSMTATADGVTISVGLPTLSPAQLRACPAN
jgi:hypothetical protein